MNSLVGYGSDDDDDAQYPQQQTAGHSSGGHKKAEDGTNYDDVNMDLSEDSGEESEPELPPADPDPPTSSTKIARKDQDRRTDKDRDRDDKSRNVDDRSRDRNDRGRDRSDRGRDRDRDGDRRDERRHDRSDRDRRSDRGQPPKRGLLGDRPDQKDNKIPSLLDLKPYATDSAGSSSGSSAKSYDARDAVSPRFTDREKDRDKERERDRHSHRSDDKRSDRHKHDYRPRSRDRNERSRSRGHAYPPPDAHASRSRDRNERSRSRGHAYPPPDAHASSSSDKRGSPPTGEFRTSYKVNKKLEVMEKMGLQIKTPDGSMATARQLRAAAIEAPASGGAPTSLPSYYNPKAVNSTKILNQVQKRKLLWSGKKAEAEEAGKWTGTRFAQDNDGKQTTKFMRLMGIKDPAPVPAPNAPVADPIKKQEELFQAMQAQYDVARATTHTMRGVGLGFQRGPL